MYITYLRQWSFDQQRDVCLGCRTLLVKNYAEIFHTLPSSAGLYNQLPPYSPQVVGAQPAPVFDMRVRFLHPPASRSTGHCRSEVRCCESQPKRAVVFLTNSSKNTAMTRRNAICFRELCHHPDHSRVTCCHVRRARRCAELGNRWLCLTQMR